MLLMQSIHGGKLNAPTLIGINALQIIGYWWRQRGRYWQGWAQCLKKLEASGLHLIRSDAYKVFTEHQSAIVWECAREAVADMERIRKARNLPPGPFNNRQSTADAKQIVVRYMAGNLDGKIPPALKPEKAQAPKVRPKPRPKPELPKSEAEREAERLVPPIPKIPDDLFEKIPRVRRPRLNISGKIGWLIIAALVADEWRRN